MSQAPVEPLHTGLARQQKATQFVDQAPAGEQQGRRIRHLCRQFQRTMEALRRHEGTARIGTLAEQALQLHQALQPQPLREPGPGQAQQIADAHQSHAVQVAQFPNGEAECRQRQPHQQATQCIPVGDDGPVGCPALFRTPCRAQVRPQPCSGQHQCGGRCWCEHAVRSPAEVPDTVEHPLAQCSAATEELQAAPRLQHQCRRRLQADLVAEGQGPGGQPAQCRPFRLGLAWQDAQARHQGAGGALRQAGGETEGRRGGVAGDDVTSAGRSASPAARRGRARGRRGWRGADRVAWIPR